jgi:hypothetical protein
VRHLVDVYAASLRLSLALALSALDDDALHDTVFDGFVASVIEQGGANIGVIGQPLRFLQRRPIGVCLTNVSPGAT